MRHQLRTHVRNDNYTALSFAGEVLQEPAIEAKPARKVNKAWMSGFKLKGGPPLGQLLAREYHQSPKLYRSR